MLRSLAIDLLQIFFFCWVFGDGIKMVKMLTLCFLREGANFDSLHNWHPFTDCQNVFMTTDYVH